MMKNQSQTDTQKIVRKHTTALAERVAKIVGDRSVDRADALGAAFNEFDSWLVGETEKRNKLPPVTAVAGWTGATGNHIQKRTRSDGRSNFILE